MRKMFIADLFILIGVLIVIVALIVVNRTGVEENANLSINEKANEYQVEFNNVSDRSDVDEVHILPDDVDDIYVLPEGGLAIKVGDKFVPYTCTEELKNIRKQFKNKQD